MIQEELHQRLQFLTPQLLVNWLQLKEVGLIMSPIIIVENLLNNPPRPVKDIDVNLVFQYVHCKCCF